MRSNRLLCHLCRRPSVRGLRFWSRRTYGLPWTAVRVTPSNRRIPGASDTIDPGKLVSHLTWVPFMGAVEFRSEPYSLMLDYLHAPLKSGVATHNILFNGAQTGFDD